MRNLCGRFWLVCCGVGLLGANAAAQPGIFSLKAAKINPTCLGGTDVGVECFRDNHCERWCGGNTPKECIGGPDGGDLCNTNSDCDSDRCELPNTISASVGDVIVAEVYASDWSPELRAWGVGINAAGFSSGDKGELVPPIGPRPCTKDEECADIIGATISPATCVDGFCNLPCSNDTHCYFFGPFVVVCDPDHFCNVEKTEYPVAGVFMDMSRADYIFSGPGMDQLVSLDTYNIKYGTLLTDARDSPPYNDPPKYCATLVLKVSNEAWGTFTIPLYGAEMADLYNNFIPVVTEPLTITIDDPPQPKSTDPPNCAIDARQMSDPDGSSPDGWDSIDFIFNGDVSGVQAGDFSLREAPCPISPCWINDIAGIDKVGNTVTVHLNERITLQKWTCVTYNPRKYEVCMAHLPSDVNSDLNSNARDIDAPGIVDLIDCLTGVESCEEWQSDIDRSGRSAPPDLLREIDMLNGAQEYASWLDESMMNDTECPTTP